MKKQNPFIALKNRNFLIYWLGLGISQSGTWMQNIAQPWLALIITNDPLLVGFVSAAQFVPIMLFSLFSGALIDKIKDKKRILYLTQGGQCLVSLIFALSVFFDFASYALVLSLAFAMGVFNSLDSPTRHAFIYELVQDRAILQNAVALNAMAVSVSRIAGPSLAGLVMASLGIGACFLANTISFVAIFCSLFLVHLKGPDKPNLQKQNVLSAVKSALIYIKKRDILLTPLLILLIFATLIPNYSVSVSALVRFELGGGDSDFGYLMAWIGVGALMGALGSAFMSRVSLKVIYFGPFACAFWLFCVGLAPSIFWAGVGLVFTGFSFIMSLNAINACLQLFSRAQFRGRVMSVYSLFFLGSTPLGAWFAGYLASEFGSRQGLFICSILTVILLILLFALKYIFSNKKRRDFLKNRAKF